MHGWKVCHLYWGGYEPRDVYNADETGLFFNVVPDRTLVYKENLAMVENIPKTDSLCYYVLIVTEVTNKCRL
jgi:hypothetical protein